MFSFCFGFSVNFDFRFVAIAPSSSLRRDLYLVFRPNNPFPPGCAINDYCRSSGAAIAAQHLPAYTARSSGRAGCPPGPRCTPRPAAAAFSRAPSAPCSSARL